MKTFKSIVLALVLLVGTTISAHVDTKKKPASITEEIGQLLENPSFDVLQDIKAITTLMINDEGEVVVLSVDTENEMVERFVKSRLNYKKLIHKLEKGKEYNVPIKIVSA